MTEQGGDDVCFPSIYDDLQKNEFKSLKWKSFFNFYCTKMDGMIE